MTVTDSQVTFGVRVVTAMVRGGFSVDAVEIGVAYPVKRRLLASGIGISLADGRLLYFWTSQTDEALDALQRQGVPVDQEPRQVGLTLR